MKDYAETFENINNRVKFSVQYIMNRTYGRNHYCAGGNFILVGNDIITGRVESL